jgi:hypothetical protein
VDTVPKDGAAAVGTEGEREATEVQQVFRDHYIAGYYPLFEGSITQIAPRIFRLDSFTMRIDSLPIGMTGVEGRADLFKIA